MFNLKSEINKSMQWKKLEKLAKKMRKVEMRDMFAKDNKKILEFKILTLQQTQVRRKMGSALENQSLSFRLRHS